MFIVGLIIGFCLGALVMNVYLKDERKERYNAEERALIHFRKLNDIEYILKNSDNKKENYFITLDKIKRVITSDQTR